MSVYFTEVHGTILAAWQNLIAYYQELIERYVRGLQSIDSSAEAIIDLDYLDTFANSVYPLITENTYLSEDIAGFVSTHSEHLSLSLSARNVLRNAADNTAGDLTQAKTLTNEQYEAMGYMDYGFGVSLDEVAPMLRGISDLSRQNQLGHDRVTFRPGSFRGSRLYNEIGINQNMKDSLAKRYFDASGNLDHFRVGFTIFSGHEHGLSDLELQVLLQTFNSQNTPGNPTGSLDAILKSYGMAYLILLTSQTDDHLNVLGILNDIDLRNHVELLANAGSHAGTVLVDGSNKAMKQLADESAANLMGMVITNLIQGGSISASDEMKLALTQAQLLGFLSEIGLTSPAWDINIENLNGLSNSHITLQGTPYHATSLYCLIGGQFGLDAFTSAVISSLNDLNAAPADNPGFWSTFWDIGSIVVDVVGLIPGADVVGATSAIVNIGSTILGMFSDNNVDLSPQEIGFINQMIAAATAQVSGGGGVAGINVPGGYHLIGTTTAGTTGVINLAGIYSTMGLTFGDVMLALTLGNVNVSQGGLTHILNSVAGGGAANVPSAQELRDRRLQIISFTQQRGDERSDFMYELNRIFRINRVRINSTFGTNFTQDTDVLSLPINILEYLLGMKGL